MKSTFNFENLRTDYEMPKKSAYFYFKGADIHQIYVDAEDSEINKKIDATRAKLAKKFNASIEEIGVIIK